MSLSSEVLPQIKEYERFGTTVVNAYVGPALATYLGRLDERLKAGGYAREVLIMQSHGGVAGIADSVRLAAGAVLSGPAGGIAGSRHAARLLGHGDLITFDMGGTSTDIALLQNGEPQLTGDKTVGPSKVALPADRHPHAGRGRRIHRPRRRGRHPPRRARERGRRAGTGLLRPRAARRRRSPTPTWCWASSIPPTSWAGARASTRQAAERAVAAVAKRLGTSTVAAAEGIQRVVNTNMAEGIRLVSVRRGADPRRFALLAFGGAAGLHVTEVARMLEISRVVVPRVAAVLSAWGMLTTDLRHELVRTHVGEAQKVGGARLRKLFGGHGGRRPPSARRGLRGTRARAVMPWTCATASRPSRSPCPLADVNVDAADLMDQVVERFHRRHEELYTYSAPGQDVVLVNARVAVIGELPSLPAERESEAESRADAQPKSRRAYIGRWIDVPVYDLETRAGRGSRSRAPRSSNPPPPPWSCARTSALSSLPLGWLDIALR